MSPSNANRSRGRRRGRGRGRRRNRRGGQHPNARFNDGTFPRRALEGDARGGMVDEAVNDLRGMLNDPRNHENPIEREARAGDRWEGELAHDRRRSGGGRGPAASGSHEAGGYDRRYGAPARRGRGSRGRGSWFDADAQRRAGGPSRSGDARNRGNWFDSDPPRAVVDSDVSSPDGDVALDYVKNLLGEASSENRSSAGSRGSPAPPKPAQPIKEPEVLRWATNGAMLQFLLDVQGLQRFLAANTAGSDQADCYEFKDYGGKLRAMAHRLAESVGATSRTVRIPRHHLLVFPAQVVVEPERTESELLNLLKEFFPMKYHPPAKAGRRLWKLTAPGLAGVQFQVGDGANDDVNASSSSSESDDEAWGDAAGLGGRKQDVEGLVDYAEQKRVAMDAVWGDEEVDDELMMGDWDSERGKKAMARFAGATHTIAKAGQGKPIDSSNVGFALLQKMGWNAGEGLGAGAAGRKEPVENVHYRGRGGLGQ